MKKTILTAERLMMLAQTMGSDELLIHRSGRPGSRDDEFVVAPVGRNLTKDRWSIHASEFRFGFSAASECSGILKGFFGGVIPYRPNGIEHGNGYECLSWTIPKDGAHPAEISIADEIRPSRGKILLFNIKDGRLNIAAVDTIVLDALNQVAAMLHAGDPPGTPVYSTVVPSASH